MKKHKECSHCKHEMKKEMPKSKKKETSREKSKIEKVMKEGKSGKLHSGSKKGPIVTNPKQMIAIALSESRKRKK